MSRLMQRLKAMEAQADPKRRAERESHNLAGDGLEMAARTALEAWQSRPRHPDESDVFRLGYRLACHELALVFRAMRKGVPPTKDEFDELRALVFGDAAEEAPGPDPFGPSPVAVYASEHRFFAEEQTGPSMGEKIAELGRVIGHTPPEQFIAENESYCSMHGGPLDGGVCISCSEQAGEEPEE